MTAAQKKAGTALPEGGAQAKPSTIQHTVASQLAAAVSTVLVYPVHTVSVRFMSQDGTRQRQHNHQTYRSLASTFRTIITEEGPIRPFFRGCHVAVLGAVCAWGSYMYFYRWQCAWYETYRNQHGRNGEGGARSQYGESLDSLLQRFGFSIVASSLSAMLCNPIFLMKTRMQLEETVRLNALPGSAAATAISPRHFATFRGGVLHTIRMTGFHSLWRGTSAQVLLGITNAFMLPVYDAMKSYILVMTGHENLSVAQVCLCSTIAKTLIAVMSQPFLVVKTRLQDHRSRDGEIKYTSVPQSVRTILERGGVRGFYRGLVPVLLQTVPRSVLLFVLYEQFLHVTKRILP